MKYDLNDFAFVTVKDGLWSDPSIWKDRRIPGNGPGRILIRHTVIMENDWGRPDPNSQWTTSLNALNPSAGYH